MLRLQLNDSARRKVYALCALALVVLALPPSTARASDELDLGRYRGKVVVVDFWASWCAPCRRSFPWLNTMHERFADRGLVVIGVNVDRERAAAERFLREVPAAFPIVYDPAGALAARYRLTGMPSSLVFGPDGELVETHVGFRDAWREAREAQLIELLQRLPNQARSSSAP